MKSQRSALLGLALGVAVLGMTACETKDSIIIEPPVDPITVSLVPDALTLEVGATAQLVAVVTGGETGTARTVTFSSSNTSVATVDANGVVTAVAPGVATITARSTADTNAADASAITVVQGGPDPGDITISIASITRAGLGNPVTINDVFGQIDVTLNIDPPPPAGFEIVTLVDGTEVCSQTISSGAANLGVNADPELGTTAQPIQIVCSFDTGMFDDATGEATFDNGPHTVSAEVRGPDGAVAATVNTTLIFNNQNFIRAEVSSSKATATGSASPRSLAAPGSLWHSGDLIFSLLPVIYNGSSNLLQNATVTITTQGYGVTGIGACVPATDATADQTIATVDGGAGPTIDPDAGGPLPASPGYPGCGPASSSQQVQVGGAVGPFDVTFPASAVMSGSTNGVMGVEDILSSVLINSVTTGGQAGPICINPDPAANPQRACGTGVPGATAANVAYYANPVRVDNLAPRVTQLSIERPPNQYFGPNVFTLTHAALGTTPACNAPCATTVDYGVGGQTGTGSSFLAGPPASTETVTNGGAELDESGTSNDYVFGVTAVDASANSRTRWATPTTTTSNTTAANAGNRRFGWDATDPTFAFASGPADMSVNPGTAWLISFVDAATPPAGPSGFLTNPVRVKLEHFAATNGSTNPICRNPDTPGTQAAPTAGVNCATAGVGTGFFADDGNFPLNGADLWDGYYRATVFVVDAAANDAAQATRWYLDDQIAPTFTGGIVVPSTVTGGASTPANVDITENVDLGSLIPYVDFAGVAAVGFTQQVLGTFDPTSLVGTSNGAYTIPTFPRSWDGTNASGVPSTVAPATVQMATHIEYNVRDMAGHQLRFAVSPWPAAPNDGLCPAFGAPNTATQNCSNRQTDISVNVLAGAGGAAVAAQYGALNTLFADVGNPNIADVPGTRGYIWGSFRMAPPAATPVVCNNTALTNCAAATPTTVTLTAVVQGPVGSFQTPFQAVDFYYLHPVEGRLEHIGTAAVAITDETVQSTRTFNYTATWDLTNLKVRPAGAAPGTDYTVLAIGRNATGDLLATSGTPFTVTVHGN